MPANKLRAFTVTPELFDKQNLLKIARYKMPFGKYAGRALIHLPEEYLLWFANKDGFPEGELGELMELCLALRIEGLESLIIPLCQGRPVAKK